MNELEQILNEIHEYEYREEGNETDLQQEALSFKINLLKVIVEIFYTHVSLMDNPKKRGSFLNDIDEIEKLIKDQNEEYLELKYKSGALEDSPRVPLDNVDECEKFILSKYKGNTDFIQKTLWNVKKYYTKEHGMLFNFDSKIFNLCSETPKELLAKIVEQIEKGVDSGGYQIIGWEAQRATGENRYLLTSNKNNLNEKYNLLLAVPNGKRIITVSAHFKEQQPVYLHRPNDDMKRLLLHFNTLWRDQLSSLAK